MEDKGVLKGQIFDDSLIMINNWRVYCCALSNVVESKGIAPWWEILVGKLMTWGYHSERRYVVCDIGKTDGV